MNDLEAVIFDLDGCLADSEPISLATLAATLRAGGIAEVTPEALRDRFLGLTISEGIGAFADRLVGVTPAELVEDYHRRLLAAYADGVPRIAGMTALLDRLETGGIATCIASGGAPDRIRRTLEGAGLLDRFEGRLFSAEDVPRGKPAPDLVLAAARGLAVAPETCLVIEDSPHGVRGAVAAGMIAIGFTGGSHLDGIRDHQAAALRAAGASHVVAEASAIFPLIETMGYTAR